MSHAGGPGLLLKVVGHALTAGESLLQGLLVKHQETCRKTVNPRIRALSWIPGVPVRLEGHARRPGKISAPQRSVSFAAVRVLRGNGGTSERVPQVDRGDFQDALLLFLAVAPFLV